MPYLIFLAVCATWSISFILMKKSGLVFSPLAIAAGRAAAGAIVLGILWGWRERTWNLRRSDLGAMAVVVVAGCAWPYYIQPWLINRHGSAFMALMVSFVPLLTMIVSLPVLGVRPTLRQGIGVVGAIVCLGVLLADGLQRQVPAIDIALALSVPLGYAITNTVIRRWLAHVTPLLLTLMTFVVSIVFLAPLACIAPAPSTTSSADWSTALAALIFLGVVGTGLATLLFNKLIRDHGPLFAGMTTNLVPLGAVLVGWLDAEPVTPWQVAALLGILAMVTLVQFRAASRAAEVKEEKAAADTLKPESRE
jgi:drug/metabolite transporter (DMT)-like permease